MFDKNKFRARVIELGMKMSEIAECLGINQTTLNRKINGISDFSRSEIQVLIEKLNLNTDLAVQIFFAT